MGLVHRELDVKRERERDWTYTSFAPKRWLLSRLRYSVFLSQVTLPMDGADAGVAGPDWFPLANVEEDGSARRNASLGSSGGKLRGSGLISEMTSARHEVTEDR